MCQMIWQILTSENRHTCCSGCKAREEGSFAPIPMLLLVSEPETRFWSRIHGPTSLVGTISVVPRFKGIEKV